MLSTNGDVPRMGSQITANNYNFEDVKEFIYLGTFISTNNDVSVEIKRRVTLANRAILVTIGSLVRQNSHSTRHSSYPCFFVALRHGHCQAAALRVFERKVLRRIFNAVRVGDKPYTNQSGGKL